MPTQLPRVPSLIPSSFATLAIGRDVSITIFTASSLNSGEKLFLGRGNYFTFPDGPSYWMDCPEGSGHLNGELAGDGDLVVHDLVPAGGVGGQGGVAVGVGVAAGLHEDGLVAALGAGLDPGGHPGGCLVAEVLAEGPGQRRFGLSGRPGGRAGGGLRS